MIQRVLITAGASGIGLAIAKAFAADGARIHIADIDGQAVDGVTRAHEQMTGSVTDVSDPDAVKRRGSESAISGLHGRAKSAGL